MDNRYLSNWHFTHPPRQEQKDIMEFVASNKHTVLAVDAPTGVGKSPACITLAVTDGGTILTTQKILQDQYLRDWPHIPLLKGASNYLCSEQLLEEAKDASCEVGKKRHKCRSCPYAEARDIFLKARASITNYAYAMASFNTKFQVPRKKWLILDEGHHVESALINAAEVSINERFCFSVLNVSFSMPRNTQDAIKFAERIAVVVKAKMDAMQDAQEAMMEKGQSVDMASIKVYTELERLLNAINIMLEDTEGEWIFGPFERRDGFTIRPLMADGLFKKFILPLGERVYITSATLLRGDLMASWLGINEKDFKFMAVDSPFPVDNRLVYYTPVASMSYKNYGTSLPKIAQRIKRIISHPKYVAQKGIIHTNSFKLSRDLMALINDPRMLAHDDSNREEILQRHLTSEEPTILVSPSMTEGVDLKDNLSRFTIFPKVPYPAISDAWTKFRADKDRRWYSWQTLKSVVQGVGRSVRGPEDYADAYILDSCWENFWDSAASLSPEWFSKSLRY